MSISRSIVVSESKNTSALATSSSRIHVSDKSLTFKRAQTLTNNEPVNIAKMLVQFCSQTTTWPLSVLCINQEHLAASVHIKENELKYYYLAWLRSCNRRYSPC